MSELSSGRRRLRNTSIMVFLLMLLMKTGSLSWNFIKAVNQRVNFYGKNKWKVMENGWISILMIKITDILLHTQFKFRNEVRKDAGFVE